MKLSKWLGVATAATLITTSASYAMASNSTATPENAPGKKIVKVVEPQKVNTGQVENTANSVSNSPFVEMDQLQGQMNRLFNSPFFEDPFFVPRHSPLMRTQKTFNSYPQNLFLNKKDNYLLEIVVPGMKKNDIKIEVKGRLITVTGQNTVKKTTDNKKDQSFQSYTSNFAQTLRLPDDVNIDKISSECKDGVLKITLPKDLSKVSVKEIPVS